ncbi:MAG: hypothetical protein IJE14_00835 [Clostridia bacterium]|nr:hypothetical protein [Clostridia bacterium]
MARINPVDYGKASEEIKALHDEYAKKIPMNNMKLTLLNNPVAFRVLNGFHDILKEAKAFLGELTANLFCYSISTENDCAVCSQIFRNFLDENGVDFDALVMTPEQHALISYGRNIADNPHEVYDEQMDELKEYFTDEQIVVITSLAAMMVASNIINTVLEIDM